MKKAGYSANLLNNGATDVLSQILIHYGDLFFPVNTKRRLQYKKFLKGMEIVKKKGLKQFILS